MSGRPTKNNDNVSSRYTPPKKSPPYVIDIMDRNLSRYSKYRVMWLLVFFDLPTETKKDRKAYTEFKKRLLNDGFTMFQFSIYVRHCASRENMAVHARRIRSFLPPYGKVGILGITDKHLLTRTSATHE